MYIYTTKKCIEKVNISVHFPTILDHQKPGSIPSVLFEIVKSYVRESLSSLTPRHFWALLTTSLMLTCLNSHLLTYVPLPLTTSRHRQCLVSQGFHYLISTWCAPHRNYVYHPHWAWTSILGNIFIGCSMPAAHCSLKFSSAIITTSTRSSRLSEVIYQCPYLTVFNCIP